MKKILCLLLLLTGCFTSCVIDSFPMHKFGFFIDNQTDDTIYVVWREDVHTYTGNTLQYTSLESIGFWSWEYSDSIAPNSLGPLVRMVSEDFENSLISIFIFNENTRRNYTIKELKEMNYCDSIITISYPELLSRGFRIVYDGEVNVENEESEE